MDPLNEEHNLKDTLCLITMDDLYNNYYSNQRLDEKDCIFSTLMNIVTPEVDHCQSSFRNLFVKDAFVINLLEKQNSQKDLVFYVITKALNFVKNSDHKIIYNNFNFSSIFTKQIYKTTNTDCFYPTIKIIKNTSAKNRYYLFVSIFYLFSCLKRLYNICSVYSEIDDRNLKIILDETENQLLNHISLMDNGFVNTKRSLIHESLLLPFIIDNDQHFPFITKLVLHLYKIYGFDSQKPTSFYTVFGNILMNIHHYILNYPIESEYHELLLRSMYQLMSIRSLESRIKYPIIALITKLPMWKIDFVTDAMGKEFERLSFLGTLFSGSMFADDNVSEVAINHFKDENMHESQIIIEQKSLQSKLEIIWEIQFQIIKLFLVEKSTHDDTIDFLNRALCVNKTRGHMQPDETTASGEGFITNLNATLQRLVSPIKIDRVDLNFLTANIASENDFNLAVLLKDETRIFFDNETLMTNYRYLNAERKPNDTINFHTNIFYLSAVGHHYGIVASIRKQSRRSNAIQSLERSIGEITRIIDSNQFASNQIQVHKNTLSRYKSMISFQKRAMLCSQIILFHDIYLRSSLEFYNQVSQVLSLTIGSDISALSSIITTVSSSFSAMPQFLLDDMADFLLYLISKKPHIFSYLKNLPNLCSFILFISTHSSLVKSPYLVAKFVEILFSCLPSVNNNPSLHSVFQYFMNHYSITSGFLTKRLIQFYIDVEKTGASSEFYDKFSIRFKISIIFRSLWKQGSQMKIHLLNEVANNLNQFVKFINRAMNDMVYLLDESITALKRIRTNQEKRNDKDQWLQASRQEQAAILQQLNHDERSTKSQLTLADVTVEMLYDFTNEIKDPFLCSELVEKLAAMLNSFLLELVGPKCRDLKVHEPEKYNWNPKKLLQNIIRIYLNLDSPTLIEAISNEERFYSTELFINAMSKLDNYNIISKHELEHFDIFQQKVKTLVTQRQTEDAYADNVPPEYLDPIMSCIMKEPVMLPQSKIIVDKSVIKRHLLNDDCDPFTRQPLKLEDLIPQPDLQRKIQDWKLSQRKANKQI